MQPNRPSRIDIEASLARLDEEAQRRLAGRRHTRRRAADATVSALLDAIEHDLIDDAEELDQPQPTNAAAARRTRSDGRTAVLPPPAVAVDANVQPEVDALAQAAAQPISQSRSAHGARTPSQRHSRPRAQRRNATRNAAPTRTRNRMQNRRRKANWGVRLSVFAASMLIVGIATHLLVSPLIVEARPNLESQVKSVEAQVIELLNAQAMELTGDPRARITSMRWHSPMVSFSSTQNLSFEATARALGGTAVINGRVDLGNAHLSAQMKGAASGRIDCALPQ